MRRNVSVCMATTVLVALMAITADTSAAGLKVCVPEKEGKGFVTPTKGACKKGYKLSELPGEEETKILEKVVPHIKYEEKGIGGKPTVQFSSVNVQIVNGEGRTASTNGEGNLVIGYDEDEFEYCTTPFAETKLECESEGGEWIVAHRAQSGSHNLVLGEQQTFTSYGGILGGSFNTITAPFASVSGGEGNRATGDYSSILGGASEEASAELERRPRPSAIAGAVNTKAEFAALYADPGTSASISQIATGEYELIIKGVGSGCPLVSVTPIGEFELYTPKVTCESKAGAYTGKFRVLTSNRADDQWYFTTVGVE